MSPRTLVLYGVSGSGKGTQAALVTKRLKEKYPHDKVHSFSSGERLRLFMQGDTYTAERVKAILDEGGLLPAFLPVWLWTGYLHEVLVKNTEHLVLDGIARRVPEAEVLNSALSFYEREEKTDVVVINVSKQSAKERLLKRARFDDTPADIENRLRWFETNVIPAIDYFRNKSKASVHDIDGERSVEEVFEEIARATELQ